MVAAKEQEELKFRETVSAILIDSLESEAKYRLERNIFFVIAVVELILLFAR